MCVFCDIIEGKIPSYTIYEDKKVKAFFDISQVTKGHTLIVVKQHCEHFMDCDDETLAHVMQVAKKIAVHLQAQSGAAGMNILSNAKAAAGQTVPHFHVHVIPRYDENDAIEITFRPSAKQDLPALCEAWKLPQQDHEG